MTKISRISLTAIMLIIGIAVASAGVQLRVQGAGGGRQIGVGDRFYIIYTLTNIQGEPPAPANVPGAKVIYFTMTGQSSSFTSVNGKTSQSVSYTYTATLKAEKEGSFHFGPVTVDGQKSNQVSYQIVSASVAHQQSQSHSNSASSQANSGSRMDPYSTSSRGIDEPKFIGKGNDKLFLRATLDKSTAYEQEALIYTVKLYSTYAPIKFIGATDAPKFDGFVIEESDAVSRSLSYETYQGRQYATAVIARYIIFPQQDGKLTIKGNTYTVSTDEQEYYQDPYFSTMTVRRPIQLNVTPNDLTVTVKPLPSPRPADFSGGVGNFKLTSALKSSEFKTNQTASILYTVEGSGNLKYVHLPELGDLYPKQLEIFSPSVEVDAKTGSSNVSGKSVFDYSFVPLETGSYRIPEISLCFFNPSTGKYERSTARGYDINVAAGTESAKSQTRSTRSFDRKLLSPGRLSFQPTVYIDSWAYWLAYILPALLLACIVWYYRKLVALRADELGMKSRKAGKVASRRLRRAADCLKKNDRDNFYGEMLEALWGYVGDKLGIPISELNRENVVARLGKAGIVASVSESFVTLVDECEFAKYSSNISDKTMDEIYDKGVSLINSLEDGFRKQKKNQKDNEGHV